MKPPWVSHELPHYESPCYGFSSTSVEAPHPTSTWVGGGKVRWSNWGIQLGSWGILQDFEWPHVEKIWCLMNHIFWGISRDTLWRKKNPFRFNRFQALFKGWYFIHCGVPPPHANTIEIGVYLRTFSARLHETGSVVAPQQVVSKWSFQWFCLDWENQCKPENPKRYSWSSNGSRMQSGQGYSQLIQLI